MKKYLGYTDPLINKNHYMYSPFYGVDFVDSFLSSRAEVAQKLESIVGNRRANHYGENRFSKRDWLLEMNKCSNVYSSDTKDTKFQVAADFELPDLILSRVPSERISASLIWVISELNTNVNYLLDKEQNERLDELSALLNSSALVWLERLLNSFEIAKKLGSSETNPRYVACFTYFSISLCLALIGLKSTEYRHERVGSLESRKYLKILNGLIKSNDVLCFYINQKEYGFLSELKNKSQALNYAYLALVFELDTIKKLSEQKNVI